MTLAALEALAHYLSAIPDRPNVQMADQPPSALFCPLSDNAEPKWTPSVSIRHQPSKRM
jgi:hypothetical protein